METLRIYLLRYDAKMMADMAQLHQGAADLKMETTDSELTVIKRRRRIMSSWRMCSFRSNWSRTILIL